MKRYPPLFIMMMLHYYALPGPYAENEPRHQASTACQKFHEQMVREQLLRRLDEPDNYGCGYEITQKGRAYVDALCVMPLPVAKWVIPEVEAV